MTVAATILLLVAAALRTRLGRLYLARVLLVVGNALGEAGSRVLDDVQREMGR